MHMPMNPRVRVLLTRFPVNRVFVEPAVSVP
jgi:hypothetical protein